MFALQSAVPAVASAIAASFAALTAFLVMLIQRRTSLDAARPEIVLTDWKRCSAGTGDSQHDVISFGTIRNIGHGPAFHLHLNSFANAKNRPTYSMSTTRVPILGAGESAALDCEIVVRWKNVPGDAQRPKFLPIKITIYSWDSRNWRHETTYSLIAMPLDQSCMASCEIAPGVMFGSRTTASRPVWMLKSVRVLKRLLGHASQIYSRWHRMETAPDVHKQDDGA